MAVVDREGAVIPSHLPCHGFAATTWFRSPDLAQYIPAFCLFLRLTHYHVSLQISIQYSRQCSTLHHYTACFPVSFYS